MIDLHQKNNGTLTLTLVGDWELSAALEIKQLLSSVPTDGNHSIYFDAKEATYLDISATWLIYKHAKVWEKKGSKVFFKNFPEEYFSYFLESEFPLETTNILSQLKLSVKSGLTSMGYQLSNLLVQVKSVITFFGHSLVVLGRGILRPRQLRIPAIFHQVFKTGISALPIVALLACLISIVVTYQGGAELKNLGASIYTVDLVAVSILRELGVLLTAIMVAGRSSSAFAAEIGNMKTNQEIDALQVTGINPYEILVVPRMVALLIALPLLTLMADLLALAGAAIISSLILDISIIQFVERLHENIEFHTFAAGMIKAPFFAIIIAIIGCWNGMQVTGSSESLGQHTTAAVVQSIFMVLLLDGAFSILYYTIGF
jgi:phospholipid/cholesterol/gamma-HCH transport system permease protein